MTSELIFCGCCGLLRFQCEKHVNSDWFIYVLWESFVKNSINHKYLCKKIDQWMEIPTTPIEEEYSKFLKKGRIF